MCGGNTNTMNMFMGATHSPNEHTEAKLKYEDEMARRKYDRARKGKRGGPGHVDDVAIGDEDQDITRVDIDKFAAEQKIKDSTKNRFNVNYVVAGGVIGSLLGSLLGALQINKFIWRDPCTVYNGTHNLGTFCDGPTSSTCRCPDPKINYEVATSTMWGLLLGCTSVSMCVSVVMLMYIYCNSDARWKAAQARRVEALRRKEQEMIERHDEFVYYDARRSQNRCCKCLLCFHYGKITSERIIYSANPPWPANSPKWCDPKSWCRLFQFAVLRRCFCGRFERDVEALDYDLIFDVSVVQRFYQCATDTGSVIIHCEAAMDVSMQKRERERIILAMKNRDEEELLNALHTAGNIKALQTICMKGRQVLEELRDERRAKCKAEGVPYKEIFALEKKGTNTSKNIVVRDVVNPYAVMDDISYRIAKHHMIDQRERLMEDSAPMSSRTTVGQEILDRPSAGAVKAVG